MATTETDPRQHPPIGAFPPAKLPGSEPHATLPSSRAVGALGVPQLKRIWAGARQARAGVTVRRPGEARLDRMVLDALGLGLHQTLNHLFTAVPTFEQFEAWVVATAGEPDPDRVRRLRAAVAGEPPPREARARFASVDASPPVLGAADLACWRENGYVILRQAIAPEECAAAERAIYAHACADPDDPDSWYQFAGRHGIMVELIQHEALEAVRRSPRVHKAFAQLWHTPDLWASADRCGFHPPQRPGYPFPGPDLHWDMDFGRALEFGTQGILYLTDTPPEQGALTVVPGFHRRLPEWLAALPEGASPQRQDLHALGPRPIGGGAGDLVIWHQWLPHGARPNLGRRPRIVQYVNLMESVSAIE